MIEVADLHTYRGINYVLQGVSLRIADGACTVLLGRNGMGKTTLVHTIMGLLRPRSGRITLDDEELTGRQPFQIAQRGLALIPQGRRIFPSLTVEENLTLAARGSGGPGAWTLARVYDLFPNLAERRRNRGGQLSGGEQQMLAVGRALLTNPRLLLMDEPSEGLAPVIVERIGEILSGQKPGRTIPEQLTIFDTTGLSVLDISTAMSIYRAAKAQGIGCELELI
ncbi:MAG: ATP-binding cassette domain-containing protein [Nocardiopsaceae bacterium]|nr:ATP-binding cassette domain-containing protein [Nocardiopsaceae bacterium]